MTDKEVKGTVGCRNATLDIVRGLAILIVVYGHALQAVNGMTVSGGLHKAILLFQMPLFMAVSGFAAALGRPRPFVEALKQKAMRLLVPYFCWTVIYWAIRYCQGYHVNPFVELLGSQFWFLRILFLISLCALLGQSVAKREKIRIHRALRILLGGCVYVGSILLVSRLPEQGAVLHYGIFFGLGYASAKISVPRPSCAAFVGGLLFVGILPCVPFAFDRYLMAVFGSLLVVSVALVWNKIGHADWLGAVGSNTLPIYAIHWCLFFAPLTSVWQKLPGMECFCCLVALILAFVWLSTVRYVDCLLGKWAIARNLLLGHS